MEPAAFWLEALWMAFAPPPAGHGRGSATVESKPNPRVGFAHLIFILVPPMKLRRIHYIIILRTSLKPYNCYANPGGLFGESE